MNCDNPDDFLTRAALRAARGPAPLVSSLIEAWRRAFPEQSLEGYLACSTRIVAELALCRRPRYEQWLEDGGLDAAQRANVIWKRQLAEYTPPAIDAAVDEALLDFIARRKSEMPDEIG